MRLNKDIDKMIAKVAAGMIAGGLVMPEEAEAMYVGPSATGWAKLGNKFSSLMDRKVRAEISDAGMKWKKLTEPDKTYFLSDVIDHPELYEQYPDLRNLMITRSSLMKEGGSYNSGNIMLGQKEGRGSLGHEIQHAIQEKEGWARGGNDSMKTHAYNTAIDKKWSGAGVWPPERDIMDKYYLNLAGEIEARDTAARMGLSASERARQLPYSGQGIPLKDTITKMGVAAPVGAILAERMAQRKSQAEAWEGQGLEDAYGPGDFAVDVAATAATGGAYLPAKAALVMGTKAGASGLAFDLMMNQGIGPTLKNALIGGGYINPLSIR